MVLNSGKLQAHRFDDFVLILQLVYFREQYLDYLTYHIMETSLKWSTMFGLMEKAKSHFDIEDYALGQTSLEQVFLSLTAYQRSSD